MVDLASKMVSDLFGHLARQSIACIEHSQHDPLNEEVEIDGLLYPLDTAYKSSESFHRIVLTLHWNENRLCRSKGINCKNAESWWAIKHNDIVCIQSPFDRVAEMVLSSISIS